ncbi:MAG: hypothetical protein WBH03_05000 [Cyclobacteriaceae bacterium]
MLYLYGHSLINASIDTDKLHYVTAISYYSFLYGMYAILALVVYLTICWLSKLSLRSTLFIRLYVLIPVLMF